MKNISSTQSQRKVKIYYLKNQQRQQQKIKLNIKNQPSLSSLASLIQINNQKMIPQDSQYPFIMRYNYKQQKNYYHEDNTIEEDQQDIINQEKQINYKIKANENANIQSFRHEIHSIQTEENAILNIKRKAYTANILMQAKTNNNSVDPKLPQTTHRPRLMIKNTQQQKHDRHRSMHEKNLLCNIVKEWGTYKQFSQKKTFKITNQRLNKIKPIRQNEEQQLARYNNKCLMREHFNLFLQNQKTGRMERKKAGISKLKAIHHREGIQRQKIKQQLFDSIDQKRNYIGEKKNKTEKNQDLNNFRIKYQQKPISYRQKPKLKQKINFISLIEGPQSKLVPFLMNKKYKIDNFQWSKLDEKSYSFRKRANRNANSILQQLNH